MNCQRNYSCIFILLVVIAGIGYGGYYMRKQLGIVNDKIESVARDLEQETKAVKVSPPAVLKTGPCETTAWMDIQRQVKNTIVKIVTNHAMFNWTEPYKTPAAGGSSGSGFFINGDGDIVTNYHVINQARLVEIEIPALGPERLEVEIVGVSPERDLAVLRLTPETKSKIKRELGEIPFLKFGNSDLVRRGQNVLALGYPLGVNALKSTQGIVSGRERIKLIKQSCIQTTAPINPGNSGGPAINLSGEVIGINFAGVIKAQNVGYIIPINDVRSAIKDVYKIKLLRRPLLGCLLEPSNEAMVRYTRNPEPGGYYIAKVFKNMMLEKVGVEDGDMVYEVNGFKIDRFGSATVPWNEDKVSMSDILDRLEVGDKVDMIIYRKCEKKVFEFTLEPRHLQPIRFIYPDFEDVDYDVIGGMVVMELRQNHIPLLAENSHALINYESPENQYEPALIVSYVQPTSLLHKLRLIYPGVIITEINGEKVKTLDEFRNAVKKSKSTRFLTVGTEDSLFVVLSVDNIVKDEDRVSKIYHFEKSELVEAIA